MQHPPRACDLRADSAVVVAVDEDTLAQMTCSLLVKRCPPACTLRAAAVVVVVVAVDAVEDTLIAETAVLRLHCLKVQSDLQWRCPSSAAATSRQQLSAQWRCSLAASATSRRFSADRWPRRRGQRRPSGIGAWRSKPGACIGTC